MNKKIDVIVVNWNSGRQLKECIESIWEYGAGYVSRCIVVDNGSTDGSLDFIADDQDVSLVRADCNLGFAKACNIGAGQASSDFLLFLNPDAKLMRDSLSGPVSLMHSQFSESVGICGVKLLDEHFRVQLHCVRFPSFRNYFGSATGLSALFPRWFPSHFMNDFDHMSNREVDHVIGAFFLVRRSLFEQLHGFDERYFVYLEDLDFSLRAHKLGWKTHYLADAVAYHKGGGTSEQVKAHRLFYSLRSRMIYAFRHFSRPAAWGVVGLTMLVEPWPRLVRAVLRRSWQEARDTLRGYCMLWKDLPATLQKGRRDG